MKRIIVIGCPGSGKSRFSRELCARTELPLHHLDMLYWNEDKTVVDRDVFLSRLSRVLEKDEWIIDGNYSSTMEQRLEKCDTVFFLDYSVDVCLDGVRKRRGIARSDIPWIETEDDEEFVEYIKSFNESQRPQILALLEKYTDKKIFSFKERREADEFLAGLSIKV